MAAPLTVNEKSTCLIDVAYWDEDGVAAVPSAATYRIDDAGGTAIVPATALTGLAAAMTIEVTPVQNAMMSEANAVEERIVTVEWTYGSARKGTDEYRYRVRNLSGVA